MFWIFTQASRVGIRPPPCTPCESRWHPPPLFGWVGVTSCYSMSKRLNLMIYAIFYEIRNSSCIYSIDTLIYTPKHRLQSQNVRLSWFDLSKLTITTTIFEIIEIRVEEGVDIGSEIKDLMLIIQCCISEQNHQQILHGSFANGN